VQRERFVRLVRRALADLPVPYRDWIDNVDVVVERRPRMHHIRDAGLRPGETLYGLYEGIPLAERLEYQMVLPDKITIFQQPLELDCETDAELVEEVRRTVLHELAHHFGLDDDELERLGMA
jgi:predicted Zn-dependent protease with MMP-like domain